VPGRRDSFTVACGTCLVTLGNPVPPFAQFSCCGHAGLLCCGDSTFPGIGLPAVAASGAVAANSLVSPWKHWALLDELKT